MWRWVVLACSLGICFCSNPFLQKIFYTGHAAGAEEREFRDAALSVTLAAISFLHINSYARERPFLSKRSPYALIKSKNNIITLSLAIAW